MLCSISDHIYSQINTSLPSDILHTSLRLASQVMIMTGHCKMRHLQQGPAIMQQLVYTKGIIDNIIQAQRFQQRPSPLN